MNDRAFDSLARVLGRAASRRAALAGAFAALLPFAGSARPGRGPSAAACLANGQRCGKGSGKNGKPCNKCCSKYSVAQDNGKKRCACKPTGTVAANAAQCCSGRRSAGGFCGACDPGLTECPAGCVDLDADAGDCGACGNACAAGQTCAAGSCACTAASCPGGCCDGAACLDLSDQTNQACGAAGVACEVCSAGPHSAATCSGGACGLSCDPGFANCDGDPATGCETPLGTDQNCAGCGDACVAGTFCDGDTCAPCGAVGQPCCSTGTACPGGCCDTAAGVCGACVFLTSGEYEGESIGGLTQADTFCNDAANGVLPGTYKAWLSNADASPSTRFARSTAPYVRPDGVRVANDWDDLVSGALRAPISVTQSGGPPHDDRSVWTGTETDGTAIAGKTCGNWDSRILGGGGFGDDAATNGWWTARSSQNCHDWYYRLYCFQQPEA